jgi:hypothetical protein
MTSVWRCVSATFGVLLIAVCKESPPPPAGHLAIRVDETSGPGSPPRIASDASVSGAGDAEAQYRCAGDGDCITTCALGAVSAAWYRMNHPDGAARDCEDGCASKGLVARCEHAVCTTYDTRFGGSKRVDECTRRDAHSR